MLDWSASSMGPRPGQPEHRVPAQQPWLDLAVMRLGHRMDNGEPFVGPVPTLTLGDSDQMETAQAIWVLGYGQQRPIALTRHTCPGAYVGRRDDDGVQPRPSTWLLVTADMLSGHSGGPAVALQNGCAMVVGWNLMSLDEPAIADQSTRVSSGGLHAIRPINLAKQMLTAVTPWAEP